MQKLLPLLALLSGISGLAYEVLYARLFTSFFGDTFSISATIVMIFFLGIAFGAFQAHSLLKKLAYIELFLAVYALGLVYVFSTFGFSVTEFFLQLPFGSDLDMLLSTTVLLIPPAFAVGVSVPLFAGYLYYYRGEIRGSFATTYLLYNIGAALSVLAIGFVLIQYVGIYGSIFIAACINLFVAGSLIHIPVPQISLLPLQVIGRANKRAVFISLMLVSVGSGIAQANILHLSQYIAGPLYKTFALFLGAILISIALGSYLVQKSYLTFKKSLLFSSLACASLFAFIHPFILIYSHITWSTGSILNNFFALCALALLMTLPLYLFYGATVPALTKKYGIGYGGLFIAISSIGNVLGYLFFMLILIDQTPHLIIFLVASVISLGALLFVQRSAGRLQLRWYIAPSLVVLAGISLFFQPEYLYRLPYSEITNETRRMQVIDEFKTSYTFASRGSETTMIEGSWGTSVLHNGYLTLTLHRDGKSEIREKLVGLLPAVFTKKRERAFQLGLGTGLTADGLSRVFKSVDIAEINPAMSTAASTYHSTSNHNVLSRDTVSVSIKDGLIALLESDHTYDAVVNVVSTPAYFSANKLWTKDFFEVVNSKLNPGGVFVGWVDTKLGEDGLAIMHNTINSSFSDCIYTILSSGYFAFVCSNDPLIIQEDETISSFDLTDILGAHDWGKSLPELIDNLSFRSPVSTETTFNTIAHPYLEFQHPTEEDFTSTNAFFMNFSNSLNQTINGKKKDMETLEAALTLVTDL